MKSLSVLETSKKITLKKDNFLDAPDPQCQRLGQLCIKWPTSFGWLVDMFNVTFLGFISYLNTSNKFQNRHLPKTKMQRKNWYPHSKDLVESPEKSQKTTWVFPTIPQLLGSGVRIWQAAVHKSLHFNAHRDDPLMVHGSPVCTYV